MSRGVVSDAYAQLAAEGWLVVAPRSGRGWPAMPQGARPLQAGGRRSAVDAPVRYDLRPGRPDLSRFPRADWLRSLSAAVRGAGDAELDYPPLAGSLRLRTVLAAYRGRVRGTLAGPDDVLVCLGAAQAFDHVWRSRSRPPGSRSRTRGTSASASCLRERGLEPVPTRVDEEGIVVARAARTTRARCSSRPRTSSRRAS